MSRLPLNASVRRNDGVTGWVVRGPRRASAGMCWVQWPDRPQPVLWQLYALIYYTRHYAALERSA